MPWCPGGLPACDGAESTRKDPRDGSEKIPKYQKTNLYTVIPGSPSGCVRREIPGVTQVGKGHEGNISVVAAYVCWRKH